MKRYRIAAKAALILLSIVVASSCALMGPKVGSITIPFPRALLTGETAGDSASRSFQTGELRYVRVYLEAQGGLVPLTKSAMVFETAIPADNTITIEDVPPIRNCVLYVALSQTPTDSTEGFRIVRYVKSSTFTIVAGAPSTVDLYPLYSPFQDISLAYETRGVRAQELGGSTYLAANGVLKKAGDATYGLRVAGTNGITKINSLGAGKAINDDGTFGAEQLWINTDKGIWVLAADGLSIAQLPVKDSKGTAIDIGDILESGTISLQYHYTDPAKPETTTLKQAYAVFYQGLGKIGGAFGPGGTPGKWTWFALSEYWDKVPETIRPSLEGAKIVSDYWISTPSGEEDSFGFGVVPAIASLRIGGDIVQSAQDLAKNASPTTQQVIDTFLTGNMLSVPKVSGTAPLIKSVSKAGTTLFIGTEMGVFTVAVDAEGKLVGTPAFVDLGRAVNVVKIRATKIGDTVWTAVLSKKGTLIIMKDGALAATYLFYTGTPEFKPNAATVDPAATGDILWTSAGLVVTGSNGAVLLSREKLLEL